MNTIPASRILIIPAVELSHYVSLEILNAVNDIIQRTGRLIVQSNPTVREYLIFTHRKPLSALSHRTRHRTAP